MDAPAPVTVNGVCLTCGTLHEGLSAVYTRDAVDDNGKLYHVLRYPLPDACSACGRTVSESRVLCRPGNSFWQEVLSIQAWAREHQT
jgi:hypothetical protein